VEFDVVTGVGTEAGEREYRQRRRAQQQGPLVATASRSFRRWETVARLVGRWRGRCYDGIAGPEGGRASTAGGRVSAALVVGSKTKIEGRCDGYRPNRGNTLLGGGKMGS
jgi:hypothetical protein